MHCIWRKIGPMMMFATLGCADAITSPTASPVPKFGPPSTSEWELQGDPEPRWPVKIISSSANIVMGASSTGTARIEAGMRYDSHHARIAGTATVNDGATASSLTLGPVVKDDFWTFFGNQHQVTFEALVTRSCGSWIQANVVFDVWWMGSGGASLDSDTRSSSPSWAQAPCPEEEETVPSGGGGGETSLEDNAPVQWCVVRYSWDPETGEILNLRVLYCY